MFISEQTTHTFKISMILEYSFTSPTSCKVPEMACRAIQIAKHVAMRDFTMWNK